MPLVALRLSGGRHPQLWLRELRGSDEQAVDGGDTVAALTLLDRLLVERPGASVGPGQAARLTTSERDQALAALCSATFGDQIDGSRECAACGERFGLDFRLTALARAVIADLPPAPPDGVYAAGELRFRLPTGDDELAIAGLAPEDGERTLLERCLVAGDADRDGHRVLAAMAEVGPTLDLDLDASCSECGAANPVAFSVQAWFLGRLARERTRLPRQIHLLARAYGWGLAEILSLPRSERLALVGLVEEESRARHRGQTP